MSALCRLLVHDGVGKTADMEKRRYPAHGFGVAQADEAARRHAVVEVICSGAALHFIEVDQHIAAEDHVDVAPPAGVALVDHVDPAEPDRAAQFIVYPVVSIGY